MSNDDGRQSWGTGCLLLVIGGVLLVACGGGLVMVVGGLYYAQEAQRREMQARVEAMQLGERPLPPGAHAIAIGPDGELFWDDEPVGMEQLEQKLKKIPPQQRPTTEIVIRPGIGAPQQVVDQVLELAEDYDEIVEPLPMSLLRTAPSPAGE